MQCPTDRYLDVQRTPLLTTFGWQPRAGPLGGVYLISGPATSRLAFDFLCLRLCHAPFRYSTEFSPGFGGVLAEDHCRVALGPGPRERGCSVHPLPPPKVRDNYIS